MIQIRQGVFETNSSSTHAVALLTDEEYREYKAGNVWISRHGRLVGKDEIDKISKEAKATYLKQTEREWKECSDDDWPKSEYGTLEEYRNSEGYDDEWFGLEDFNPESRDISHVERKVQGIKMHAISIHSYDD